MVYRKSNRYWIRPFFPVVYYAIKCRNWADVQFITPPLPALFVKLISARFPVLQTITRTELYVVSC